jgi:hypothetical protein
VATGHFVALLFQFRRGYLFAVDVAAAVLTTSTGRSVKASASSQQLPA